MVVFKERIYLVIENILLPIRTINDIIEKVSVLIALREASENINGNRTHNDYFFVSMETNVEKFDDRTQHVN